MLQNVKTLVVIEGLLVIGLLLFRAALRPGDRDVVDLRAVALTLLTPAVGLLAGNALIYYAYLTIAVAFNARSRAQLCAAYLLMLPMTPLLLQEGAVGDLYLLPLSAVAAMNVGALIGVAVTRRQRTFAMRTTDLGAVLLVILFAYIDGREVSATSVLRTIVVSGISFAGPYLLVSRGIATREQLDRALMRLALAAVMAATVALFETVRHWILYQSFNDALHVPIPLQSATLGMRGGRLRTGGPLVDFSVAGVFFSAALMLMPYLKSRLRAGWFWLVVAVAAGGLVATQSRGAWIGAALGFAAILVYRGQLARAVALGVVALALRFLVFLSLGDSSGLAESLGKSGDSVGTLTYRRNLLSRGLEQVAAHPVTGQPPKELIANMLDLMQGQHLVDFVNSHLYIAMAAGLPGFAIWTAVWAVPAVQAWQYRRAATAATNPTQVPFGIIVATMVTLAATSIVDRNLTWPTIALALVGSSSALAGMRGTRR